MNKNKLVDKFWDELVEAKEVDPALDYMFKQIDSMFTAGNFQLVDEILLAGIDYVNFRTHILIGMLAITRAAKEKLTHRPRYIEMCEEVFKTRPADKDRVDRLLKNVR